MWKYLVNSIKLGEGAFFSYLLMTPMFSSPSSNIYTCPCAYPIVNLCLPSQQYSIPSNPTAPQEKLLLVDMHTLLPAGTHTSVHMHSHILAHECPYLCTLETLSLGALSQDSEM